MCFLTLCAAPCPFDLKESKELEALGFRKAFGFFGLYMCQVFVLFVKERAGSWILHHTLMLICNCQVEYLLGHNSSIPHQLVQGLAFGLILYQF